MYVAGSFVYRSPLYLSARDQRLPVSLLLVYAEFMDLLFLKDLALKARELASEWRRSARNPGQPTPQSKPLYPALFLFLLAVALLSLLANRMGTSTAIPILPTLQFVDIKMNTSTVFRELLSSGPPGDREMFQCVGNTLADRQYNCTDEVYSASLGEMVVAGIATERQNEWLYATILPPVSQGANLTFSINASDAGRTVWTPSRQALRSFFLDTLDYYNTIYPYIMNDNESLVPALFDGHYPDSRRYNQSLQVQLQ
ncbi:hypothetical protein BDV12DRAFT_168748 [Aspergillus spectabilis]